MDSQNLRISLRYASPDHTWAGANGDKTVLLDNGTTWTLARRERPHVLFAADGSTPAVTLPSRSK